MTAFARQERQTPQGEFSWEIRSVNHRYLDVSLRLDEAFRPLEMTIRKCFADKLSRGKIDAVLRYQPATQKEAEINLDEGLAQSLVNRCQQITKMSGQNSVIDPLRILQWPGVIQAQQVDQDKLNKQIMESLSDAIAQLIETRETEGQALHTMIWQRCENINAITTQIRQQMPEIIAQHQKKLDDKISQLQIDIDSARLEQELVLLAQKSDIAEEIDRLESHVAEVKQVLSRKEPVGRRLDFLMQEFNREANTLGAKSIHVDTSNHSVELKVLIEQMREQIQNIE